jgi:hypothetical protein
MIELRANLFEWTTQEVEVVDIMRDFITMYQIQHGADTDFEYIWMKPEAELWLMFSLKYPEITDIFKQVQ